MVESGIARKDPSGQISAWKLRDEIRKRLVKQLSRHVSDKLGELEIKSLFLRIESLLLWLLFITLMLLLFFLAGSLVRIIPIVRTDAF